MATAPIIVWFRRDLRLSDNPALHAAYDAGVPILPVYILDNENSGDWVMGAASHVWLYHSLQSLNDSLSDHLYLAKGDASVIIPSLAKEIGAQGVYWNRCYEPWRIERDKIIKQHLKNDGLAVESFNGSLLWEPWDKQVLKSDGTPYKVFTPFFKNCLSADEPRKPLPRPSRLTYADAPKNNLAIDDLNLLPPSQENSWEKDIIKDWPIGEDGAQSRLKDFIAGGLKGYKEGRNFPAQENVSRLSPHLHFGEVSPNQAWHAAKDKDIAKDSDNFMSELGWREFSYSLLYHNPKLKWENLQPRFNDFPWLENAPELAAWQHGQTGYPIVDAAMRELWQTGYMHNRCRMIVGSFLVKHLLIHWRRGEEWFWDCLFDADPANNTASWQWIAGCGADAAPYFRIFNPVTQGEKFDPDGAYTRRFVPELKNLPDKYLFKPWEAPAEILEKAGVSLGKTYPRPIVDHAEARQRALDAFKQTKSEDA